MVTVVLADDHTIFREGLGNLLSTQPNIKVVGFAKDGCEALDLIMKNKPDVAVIDISMPGKSGIEVLKESRGLRTAIVMLTMHGDSDTAKLAIDEGAKGYLLKEGAFDELVEAIGEVASGSCFISEPVLNELNRARLIGKVSPKKDALLFVDREGSGNEIIDKVRSWITQNLSSGFTLPYVAKANGISVSHLSRLYKKNLSISFTDDVNRIRIERAKTMLVSTDETIESIREAIGYDTSQHFYIQFKKQTGKTPKKFRESFQTKA